MFKVKRFNITNWHQTDALFQCFDLLPISGNFFGNVSGTSWLCGRSTFLDIQASEARCCKRFCGKYLYPEEIKKTVIALLLTAFLLLAGVASVLQPHRSPWIAEWLSLFERLSREDPCAIQNVCMAFSFCSSIRKPPFQFHLDGQWFPTKWGIWCK